VIQSCQGMAVQKAKSSCCSSELRIGIRAFKCDTSPFHCDLSTLNRGAKLEDNMEATEQPSSKRQASLIAIARLASFLAIYSCGVSVHEVVTMELSSGLGGISISNWSELYTITNAVALPGALIVAYCLNTRVVARRRRTAIVATCVVSVPMLPCVIPLFSERIQGTYWDIQLVVGAAFLCVQIGLLWMGVLLKYSGSASSYSSLKSTNCHRCNYDLRGTTSDRCPECGAFVGAIHTIIDEKTART
jgi:hypothetical protein